MLDVDQDNVGTKSKFNQNEAESIINSTFYSSYLTSSSNWMVDYAYTLSDHLAVCYKINYNKNNKRTEEGATMPRPSRWKASYFSGEL